IPIGLVGIALVSRFVENLRAAINEPFDFLGLVLIGLGIGGLAFGMTVTGIKLIPASLIIALIAGGTAATFAYVVHARGIGSPVIDLTLFRLVTFRAGVVGGFIFRIGAGALPFLLPLLMQLGFGMTPFQSGLITLSTAVGAMMMKWAVPRILRRVGFRTGLPRDAGLASILPRASAALPSAAPVAALVGRLLLGGVLPSVAVPS